jgi:DNA-binding CsgD family transcriptional regulator
MSAAIDDVLSGDISFPSGGRALGGRCGPGRSSGQLTPQQFRVLLCIADGLLNKQIAHELGLAENTVKVHVTAILKEARMLFTHPGGSAGQEPGKRSRGLIALVPQESSVLIACCAWLAMD